MPQKRTVQRPGTPKHGPAAHRAPGRPTVRPPSAEGPQAAQGKTVSLWDGKDVTLTRRHFLYGAAGAAALALLAGGGYAYDHFIAGDEVSEVLDVPENAVASSDDCTTIDDPSTVMRVARQRKLPFGTIVHASGDDVAACLLPTETASPLTQIGLLTLDSCSLTTVLKEAVGAADGFQVFDVRASAAGMTWVESNIMKGLWRVYAAALSGADLAEPLLVAQGDSAWQMPTLAAVGGYAFWQEVPQSEGPMADEPSRLMRAAFGSGTAEELYSSKGAMATAPYAGHDCVVITPTAERGKSYRQLTRIDAATGQATDALVLPISMIPLNAGWGPTGFTFCFDGIYDYGGGIANLGTYVPTALPGSNLWGVDAAAAYDSASWFRFARTPVNAPAWCGRWLMVRSTNAVCGVDPATMESFQLDLENGSTDYGDVLASEGSSSRVVTFANIDYTPLNGEREKHTLVRVWEAA